MKILITGGAGYIGSHACIEFITAGYDPVVIDNFSNSHPEALRRVAEIAGRPVTLIEGDVRDATFMSGVFETHEIDAVVHFAGLKAVGESVAKPLAYYDNNVSGSICCSTRWQNSMSELWSSVLRPRFMEIRTAFQSASISRSRQPTHTVAAS